MKLGVRSDRLGWSWLAGFEARGTERVQFKVGDCVMLELMIFGVRGALPCALPVGLDEGPSWSGASSNHSRKSRLKFVQYMDGSRSSDADIDNADMD